MTTRTLAGVLALTAALTACEESPSPPRGSLHDAIVMRDTDAVAAHLAAGADVNAADANGVTPLIAATTSGQPEVVRSLLSAGADINGRGPEESTALVLAIQARQPEMALFLLQQEGVDPEAREAHGSTPLVEAIAFHQIEVAEALLAKGADINSPGPVGRTALHVACLGLDPARIDWLLARGADPDAQDDNGDIPLHAAAATPLDVEDLEGVDSPGALRRLIDVTTDIDAANRRGQTPLHVAAAWAYPWLLEELLDAGADPLVLDEQGSSPVWYIMAGDVTRRRSRAEMLAAIALFRGAGLGDETAIDTQGGTLKILDEWAREQP